MAGYTATNAQFSLIGDAVYLRKPTQYQGMVASYRHSVQLWSSGLVASVGVKVSTSGGRYINYATIYDRSTHQVIASNPNYRWTSDRHYLPGQIGSWGRGSEVALTIRYWPATGLLYMEVGDGYGFTYFTSSYTVTSQSFTQARVGTEFGSSPWDASYSYTPPAKQVKVAAYRGVRAWTYSGHESGLWSWWVHHKLLARTGQQRVAVPHDLYDGGHTFQTWFVPKSAQ